MTLRTCLLWGCMIIVPGLAMFSHHVPARMRAAIRDHLWQPIHDAVDTVAAHLPFNTSPTPPITNVARGPEGDPASTASIPPAPAQPPAKAVPRPAAPPKQEPAARVVMPTVTVAPVNRIVEHVPPEGDGLAVPVGTSEAAARSFTLPRQRPTARTAAASAAAPEPPSDHLALPDRVPLAEPAATPEPPLTAVAEAASDLPPAADLKTQLENLGAFGVECQPTPGSSGGYASSCRVNADPSGQLHRMFHGTGADAATAMQSLLDQVHAWTRQHAGNPPARF